MEAQRDDVGRVTPYGFNSSPYSSHALILTSLPGLGRGLRILDLGCAGGYLARPLVQRGYKVVGVDISVPSF